MTPDFGLLTVLPLATPIVAVMPIIYEKNPMRIDVRVMAWQTAPQKSGIR